MEANDMKAMREALEFADEELRMATESDKYGDDLVYLVGCMRTVATACRAALAKPPRNCDVGTARQQERRHKEEVCQKSACPKHEGFVSKACRGCFAMWAQMPYEEPQTNK